MGRRLLIINALILAGIILLSRYVVSEWSGFEQNNNLDKKLKQLLETTKVQAPEFKPLPTPPEPQPFPDFVVIPEKDLFMKTRKPQPLDAPAVAEEPEPKFPKEPALNGVLNGDGKRQALITVFDNPNAKGQSKTVAVGDVLTPPGAASGWTIAEIRDTTLKLQWKSKEKIIDMFNSAPLQQAAVPQNAQARQVVQMITIGSSVAAVETVESSESAGADEKQGLVVGVAGGQGAAGPSGQRGQGGAYSNTGGRGAAQGVGGNRGRGGMGGNSNMGGMPGGGTLGMPGGGGGGNVPFNSGVRRGN